VRPINRLDTIITEVSHRHVGELQRYQCGSQFRAIHFAPKAKSVFAVNIHQANARPNQQLNGGVLAYFLD
jgi:hypothetical protein